MTPFDDIPWLRFSLNLVIPSSLILVFFFCAVGVVANSTEFHKPDGPQTVLPFWETTVQLDKQVLAQIQSLPQVCVMGTTVNEFQASQCENFWNELIKSGALALVPVFALLFYWWFSWRDLLSTYQRARKTILQGKASFLGVVTQPPEAPRDLYSWFYGLRPIMVQLKSKQQTKVYLSRSAPKPEPGTQLVLFDMGHAFGERRSIGMPYMPHVAVFRG
jgi:hypothetical protein